MRDLHHLFLIDDDALCLVENMVDRRVQHVAVAEIVFDLAKLGDVLHRAGSVERHKRDNVLNTIRFHALERIHHARAFHLKHGDSLGGRVEFVGRFIIQWDRVDVVFCARLRFIKFGAFSRDMQVPARLENQVNSILNHGKRFQAQKVELDQSGLFHPFHVELGGRHVRSRVLIKRDQRVKGPVADHHTGSVGGRVPEQPFDLLTVGQ